jgi:hypothetical protein
MNEIPEKVYIACEPYSGDYQRVIKGENAYWCRDGNINKPGYPHVTLAYGDDGHGEFTEFHLTFRFGLNAQYNFHVYVEVRHDGLKFRKDNRLELTAMIVNDRFPTENWRARDDEATASSKANLSKELSEEMASTKWIALAFATQYYHASTSSAYQDFCRDATVGREGGLCTTTLGGKQVYTG